MDLTPFLSRSFRQLGQRLRRAFHHRVGRPTPGRPRRSANRRRAAWAACEFLEERVLLSGSPVLGEAPALRDTPALRDVTVMSQNLYLGTDLNPIIAALGTGDPNVFIPAVSVGWDQVEQSDFEGRAAALADRILESQPTLIGLQEVALWQTGPALDPADATDVELDFLAILHEELAERGLHYTTVAVATNFAAEAPGLTDLTDPTSLHDIRLTDRDVILARADLRPSDLKLSGAQAENFETNLEIPLPALSTSLEITRGWTSVDAKIRGKEFRLINTHLELEVPEVGALIQVAQAQELLAGPADTDLPVILLGDFNARADQDAAVHQLLVGAGFEDAWTQTHPGEDGWTFGHDADLRNETVDFREGRIDWVLYRGAVAPLEMDLIGDELSDRTESGLWPSDHAGLVATLIISPRPPILKRLAEGAATVGIPRHSASTPHHTFIVTMSAPESWHTQVMAEFPNFGDHGSHPAVVLDVPGDLGAHFGPGRNQGHRSASPAGFGRLADRLDELFQALAVDDDLASPGNSLDG